MKKLYSKTLEKDNCGYGLICHRYGNQTREILHKSIRALESMAHRGAVGADGVTGCLLYTSPSPRDERLSRMPSSA